jgi:hypothetical protein
MPFTDYPHKTTDPGHVTSRRCPAPCGGWIVLYDRANGGLPQITRPIDESGRWVLMVRESMPKASAWAGFATKREAMEYLTLTAKGEDSCNIIPHTLETVADELALTRPATDEQAASEKAPPSDPSEVSRARERETGPKLPRGVTFQRALESVWEDEAIAQHIKAGMLATRPVYCIACKEPIRDEETDSDPPDWNARTKFTAMWMEYAQGKALVRDKPSEPKRITMDELKTSIFRNPSVRRALKRMIAEAEAAEQEAAQA